MEVSEKAVFLLFVLAILKSYILPFSCGGKKVSHKDFLLVILRNMLVVAAHVQRRQACRENSRCFCEDGASVSTGLAHPNCGAVVYALRKSDMESNA